MSDDLSLWTFSGVNSATARLPAAPIELKPAPAIKQGAASASNSLTQASSTHNATTAHKRLDIVYFRSVADRATPAVHFVPDISGECVSFKSIVDTSSGAGDADCPELKYFEAQTVFS